MQGSIQLAIAAVVVIAFMYFDYRGDSKSPSQSAMNEHDALEFQVHNGNRTIRFLDGRDVVFSLKLDEVAALSTAPLDGVVFFHMKSGVVEKVTLPERTADDLWHTLHPAQNT